jgi:hypothetical protein
MALEGGFAMIRGFVCSALPVLAVAVAAAALVGPSLIAGPGGEAMVVATGDRAAKLQAASFKPADCGALRLVALTFEARGERVSMTLREVAPDDAAPRGALLLVLDPAGEVVGVSRADAFGGAPAALVAVGCDGESEDPALPGAV